MIVKFFGAKHVSQRNYVGVLHFLPSVHDLQTTLTHVPEADDALQIVLTVRFYVHGSVADRLIAERARLVINVNLLIIQWNQIVIVFHLNR